jgi:hypothetical protein
LRLLLIGHSEVRRTAVSDSISAARPLSPRKEHS